MPLLMCSRKHFRRKFRLHYLVIEEATVPGTLAAGAVRCSMVFSTVPAYVCTYQVLPGRTRVRSIIGSIQSCQILKGSPEWQDHKIGKAIEK